MLLISKILIGIVIVYCIILIIIRLFNVKNACMVFNPIFLLGCISYAFLLFIYFCFLFGKVEKYRIDTWIGGSIVLFISVFLSLIILSISCSWRIVIKKDSYV